MFFISTTHHISSKAWRIARLRLSGDVAYFAGFRQGNWSTRRNKFCDGLKQDLGGCDVTLLLPKLVRWLVDNRFKRRYQCVTSHYSTIWLVNKTKFVCWLVETRLKGALIVCDVILFSKPIGQLAKTRLMIGWN